MQLFEGSGKLAEAKAVINGCKTDEGFRASTQLYPELWMRDLAYSEEVLLRLGHGDAVKKHLEAFIKMQRRNGNLPTVITSFWRRSLNQTFHFWTCDTELLFITALFDYVNRSGDLDFAKSHSDEIDRCFGFVGGRLNKFGLIPGSDWRDAIIGLDRRFLLSNQVQLFSTYEKLGRREQSDTLRETIREVYFMPEQGFFADSVWWQDGTLHKDPRFDCFGSAIAVLSEIIPTNLISGTLAQFQRADSGYGYRNVFPQYRVDRMEAFRSVRALNAFVRNGAVLRNRRDSYQNSAIWPFVEARVASALRKLGSTSQAEGASRRILGRRGLSEWYSPVTGEPHGSGGQLWTAAAIIAQVE